MRKDKDSSPSQSCEEIVKHPNTPTGRTKNVSEPVAATSATVDLNSDLRIFRAIPPSDNIDKAAKGKYIDAFEYEIGDFFHDRRRRSQMSFSSQISMEFGESLIYGAFNCSIDPGASPNSFLSSQSSLLQQCALWQI